MRKELLEVPYRLITHYLAQYRTVVQVGVPALKRLEQDISGQPELHSESVKKLKISIN